jgi:hypothetical protein
MQAKKYIDLRIEPCDGTHALASKAVKALTGELLKNGYHAEIAPSHPLVHVLLVDHGEELFAAASVSGSLASGMRQAHGFVRIGKHAEAVAMNLVFDIIAVLPKFVVGT